MKESAILGGGCFWCLDAVFRRVSGVLNVVCGYAGGVIDHPTYEQICTGKTQHAEVVRIEYASELISYAGILEVFFACHDPTTLNQQGNDIGTQYRSVIFYEHDEQRVAAQAKISWLNYQFTANKLSKRVETELSPAPMFWQAEDYHQDYFTKHPDEGYCRVVIAPKIRHLGLK